MGMGQFKKRGNAKSPITAVITAVITAREYYREAPCIIPCLMGYYIASGFVFLVYLRDD